VPAAQPGQRRKPESPAVWKVAAGNLQKVEIQTGLTDGIRTEIVSGDVKEGDTIATPSVTTSNSSGAGRAQSNPMFPTGGGRGGRR
jgi:multidrug efflux pump subunit AcrA (membrane-fusion protein)